MQHVRIVLQHFTTTSTRDRVVAALRWLSLSCCGGTTVALSLLLWRHYGGSLSVLLWRHYGGSLSLLLWRHYGGSLSRVVEFMAFNRIASTYSIRRGCMCSLIRVYAGTGDVLQEQPEKALYRVTRPLWVLSLVSG